MHIPNLREVESSLELRPEVKYPESPFFAGPEAPCRFEAEVYNCVVRGEIPSQVDGTYYRCMPDQLWAPLYEDDIFINGDGAIDAVRIKDGYADFKQKFVRTKRFVIERIARKAIFGKYRNRYTDDIRVRHKIHSTANTHEDSFFYVMNLDLLKSIGVYNFYGQYIFPTFIAYPKIDPYIGELIIMGYEVKGDAITDIAYFFFDKDDEEKPFVFDIVPRQNPRLKDVRWFQNKNVFYGYTGNAFDGEDGCVYLDTPLTYMNKSGPVSHYVRWKLDPNATDLHVEPVELVDVDGEMPKVDWRYDTKPYKYCFLAMHDPNSKEAPVGGGYNAIAKCNVDNGTYEHWYAGTGTAVHEVAFIPRHEDAPEADGYIISIANRHDTSLTNIIILDTLDMAKGPIAVIELPFRLRNGIHGSWVNGKDLPGTEDFCDMHGITDEIRAEFGQGIAANGGNRAL
ncbi:carotenoid oxygenase [Hypoxylon crocopeplum]|nr:carotenoid oxygenase [Hypoxylon crocopeplum]